MLTTLLVNAGIIFTLDIPWLLYIQNDADRMIRRIQGSPLMLKPLPGVIVYAVLGYLLTLPKRAKDAFLLGLSTYAVYDFTNLATLEKYEWGFALKDSLWGGVLFYLAFRVKEYLMSL